MKRVLILGATGQIAQWVARGLGQHEGVQQTLLLRNPRKLSGEEPNNAQVVIGDALDKKLLRKVMTGQDMVYANLAGEDLDKQAQAVIAAMQTAGVRRLIFVLSLGIHDEVPGRFGEWNRATIGEDLKPYRRAADAIAASGLDFTILRVDYELTGKDEPFSGTVVSRKSVADLIVQIITQPTLHIGADLGVNKPGSDGDKPYFM